MVCNRTNCCGSGTGKRRTRAAFITLKIAVFAPMPSASVIIATAVNPGSSPTCAGRIASLGGVYSWLRPSRITFHSNPRAKQDLNLRSPSRASGILPVRGHGQDGHATSRSVGVPPPPGKRGQDALATAGETPALQVSRRKAASTSNRPSRPQAARRRGSVSRTGLG